MRSPRAVYSSLAIAAVGALALATGAQALTPQFVYKNKAGTEVTVLLAKISGEQLGRGTLSIPGLNAEINCEGLTMSGSIETASDAVAILLFEECTALSITPTLVELIGCEIVTPEHEELGGGPHHITATALLLPTELTNGEPALLAEGVSAKIVFHKELGCLLPILTTLKGEICIKIDGNETTRPELLMSQTIQGECKERPSLEALTEGAGFKDKLLYGTQPAFLTSRADVAFEAGGPHEGYTLGVLLK
jgi:hypothetical protein